MKARAHLFISGAVQDAFFRSEIKHKAWKLCVKDWIRNLPDDRVEAIFEGEKDRIKEIIAFCRQGPPRAKVTATDAIWKICIDEFKVFKIKY